MSSRTELRKFYQVPVGGRFRMPRGDRAGGTVFRKLDEHRYEGEVSHRVYDLREIAGGDAAAASGNFDVVLEIPEEPTPAGATREGLMAGALTDNYVTATAALSKYHARPTAPGALRDLETALRRVASRCEPFVGALKKGGA